MPCSPANKHRPKSNTTDATNIQASATTAAGHYYTPPYWKQACTYLSRNDRVIKKLVQQFGVTARLESRGNAFVTLARSIVGQQISVKAAQSVWDRFAALCQTIDPPSVLQLAPETMRAAGLSARKVEYLHGLSQHFIEQDLQNARWHDMDDEAVISALVAIRGIGRWTAEMFLIFHLMRSNVLPLDDIGLQKGISQNYFSGQTVTRNDMREVAQAWHPYCSVATWYLWRALDPLPVAY